MSTLTAAVDGRRFAPDLTSQWYGSAVHSECTLHQIAPYIGKLKSSMASALIRAFTKKGDLIVDPFCGSGAIALESVTLGRTVVAGDWNPYASLLTRAKLFAPESHEDALARFDRVWKSSRRMLRYQDLRAVPLWVRRFFHPETLRSVLALRDACEAQGEHFLFACLLGILHHQRPGFLSYPSSHLVPYLRDRKFPEHRYPHLYKERDVRTRMLSKLRRAFRRPVKNRAPVLRRVLQVDARFFPRVKNVQAVITSPPYMNELDYVRDNRLRLWFIDKRIPDGIECGHLRREQMFRELMCDVWLRLTPSVRVGGYIVLILGDVNRYGKRQDSASIAQQVFADNEPLRCLKLQQSIKDNIPDVRRSRRDCRGTKVETILVYKREAYANQSTGSSQ
jgi:hypothetical protein